MTLSPFPDRTTAGNIATSGNPAYGVPTQVLKSLVFLFTLNFAVQPKSNRSVCQVQTNANNVVFFIRLSKGPELTTVANSTIAKVGAAIVIRERSFSVGQSGSESNAN